jgi:RNA polymerase-binding transcription factor
MNQAERAATLRRMLFERQEEVRARLRALREDLPAVADHVRDAEEQCVDDFMVGLDIALAEATSEEARRIEEALQRLEAGTYGVCQGCKAEISAPRLQALPFADLCRDCQGAREAAA